MKKVLLAAVVIGALAWIASADGVSRLKPADRPAEAGASLIIPVEGMQRQQLHDTFYEGRVGHLHHALDIMARRGTPVVAAVDGTIQKLFTSKRGGLTIYEFDAASTHSYYYAHLERYAAIHEGQKVHRGDVIGFVGSTGNASTPHLHFGMYLLNGEKRWWQGTAIDPYPELMARGITKPVSAPPARPSDSR